MPEDIVCGLGDSVHFARVPGLLYSSKYLSKSLFQSVLQSTTSSKPCTIPSSGEHITNILWTGKGMAQRNNPWILPLTSLTPTW